MGCVKRAGKAHQWDIGSHRARGKVELGTVRTCILCGVRQQLRGPRRVRGAWQKTHWWQMP